MKKRIWKIVGIVVLLLVVVFAVVVTNMGKVIKASVEGFGPAFIGVPVTLDAVRVRPLRGHISLSELVVGNPEGFKTDHAIRLGAMSVDVDLASLKTDTIIIKEILIDGPRLMFELGLRKTIVGEIMKYIESATASDTPETEQPEGADEKPAKLVIIQHVLVTGGKVGLSSPVTKGKAIRLPLPKLELHDIGKKKGGATLASAVEQILSAIYKSAFQVIASSGKLTGEMLLSLGGGALDLGGGALNLLGTGAGKAVDVAGDGVAGAAGAAKKLGGAAAGGLKKLGAGLLGGKGDDAVSDDVEDPAVVPDESK
ncbi:MAG: AsmA family protein [Kiritimatiellae bacterium]|nr:AsmA family protein [Kiritimatiellia bacterium]